MMNATDPNKPVPTPPSEVEVLHNVAFENWAHIPKGLCLIRMKHERTDKYYLHLHLKLNDGPWYNQPHVPCAYSQDATKDSHWEFWKWAVENLPTWNYPELMKSHG